MLPGGEQSLLQGIVQETPRLRCPWGNLGAFLLNVVEFFTQEAQLAFLLAERRIWISN